MWIRCHWASWVIPRFCFVNSTTHCSHYYRVSLKVAAFHEPDDSQGPKKRPRILPANLEEDIEMPSLNGAPTGDSGQGCTPIENPFSQPNFQKTPRTHQPKVSSTPSTIQPVTTCLLTPKTTFKEKMRSEREQIEAKMLRKMVKILSTSC